MTKKSWLIFAVLCFSVLGGLIWISKQSESVDTSGVDPSITQSASDKNGNIADHAFGSDNPKVTIIEYGDYQCPGCSQASPTLRSVANKYKAHIRLIFRNNPLSTIHPNALAAAAAVESAGFQGKYWEMHDKVYSQQDTWKSYDGDQRTNYFVGIAQELGLNTDTFKTNLAEADRANSRIKKKINFDKALATKQNVANATPAILVNSKDITSQRVKDGKLTTDNEAQQVWANADSLGKLIIEPLLREKGVAI